jgi:outer membrane lipoprotein LolB
VRLRLAAAAVLLCAGGCATLPPAAPSPDTWPARRAALQALAAWTLDGRIAVAAGEDGFSGGFDWTQSGERADIAVSGPLGTAGFEIHVDGSRLTLTGREGEYSDEDARVLMADRFGNGKLLPVVEMRYWLVGAPAPGSDYEESLGADQRLATLLQSGWQVRYERYDAVGGLALPARVEMTTEGLRLRVAVSRWTLPP